jgi:hypothetical protein
MLYDVYSTAQRTVITYSYTPDDLQIHGIMSRKKTDVIRNMCCQKLKINAQDETPYSESQNPGKPALGKFSYFFSFLSILKISEQHIMWTNKIQ